MEYNFKDIEKKQQAYWQGKEIYKVKEDPSKKPFYVLDMFPYPSGAGLHVGHPLGYIASDIYARFKRLQGFNVLHPMGYDAFGLPAEQYAIQTGQHPAKTTEINTARYREQLDKIGFSYDWSREFKTCEPSYYKWTQWIFLKLFNSYYDLKEAKAMPIESLAAHFEQNGSKGVMASTDYEGVFSADKWNTFTEQEQAEVLMHYRLAYLGNTMVNWCPKLGTVLANDEVSEGLSLRGGYPVEQKKMQQWCLRVSAYAERLLNDLEALDWTDALKETQRNWIGRSQGAEIEFDIEDGEKIKIFTTRPDTIYGVSFVVLAPESDYVAQCVTDEQRAEVEAYITKSKRRTERERISDRTVSGVFTGSYAVNPLSNERIPIWISDYVLAGYGTGAIMAVPAHDSRDFLFARTFDLPIVQVIVPTGEEVSDTAEWTESKDSKEGTLVNSAEFTGLSVKEGQQKINERVELLGIGTVKTNYRLRDAIFSRQRYWGEPFPIYYKNGVATALDESLLPLTLPEVDKFLPTETGEPPLGRATSWQTEDGFPFELSTMPGFAGSSAYYLRYMDPHNEEAFIDPKINNYWRQVDLYIGGTEHATGHLIYSRFWNKFLFDLGLICEEEPFKKLVNQGMIQGRSNFVYRIKNTNTFVTLGKKDKYDVTAIHVDVNIVSNDKLDIEAFRNWLPEYKDAEFILDDNGEYVCGWAIEKMSKSMHNVVNPDDIIERYGADTLRLYEMFLGPLEQSKPWDTNGIDGVHRFLKKLWGLYWNGEELAVSTDKAKPEELKSLHKLIKKLNQDLENFSFNTSISAFMICVNELQGMKTRSIEILRPLLVLLCPYAPHITEELWQAIASVDPCDKRVESVIVAEWPELNEAYLVEDSFTYPISFNGKMRFTLELSASLSAKEVEEAALTAPEAEKWLEGKTPKKVIVVPKRIVNIVL